MMADVLQKHTNVTENGDNDMLERLHRSPSETSDVSAKNSDDNLQDKEAPKKRTKRRIQQFSDSDSDDTEKQNVIVMSGLEKHTKECDGSDDDSEVSAFKSVSHKSRIRKVSGGSSSDSSISKEKVRFPQGSDSDSDNDEDITKTIHQKLQNITNGSSSESDQGLKNEQQQIRMKNKRNKIKDKFKSLMSSRGKETLVIAENEAISSKSTSEDSDNDETTSSIENIKQKIKEKMVFKPSICDPDTSDEEEKSPKKSTPKQKKEKRTIMTSPKPQRMSAKQAMENMHKIKSESNRMLREKEVSLPYHRPKALSLKDILNRRKAVSSDGKSFKIKMNGEQLKQYAQMLEERQKQMMELMQSDSDEENEDKKSGDEQLIKNPNNDEKSEDKTEASLNIDEKKENETSTSEKLVCADVSADNDKLFDDLSQSIIEDTKSTEPNSNIGEESTSEEKAPEEQDSEINMKLVFNDSETSITEEKLNTVTEITIEEKVIENTDTGDKNNEQHDSDRTNIEADSQFISLHYVTDTLDGNTETLQANVEVSKVTDEYTNVEDKIEAMDVDGFSDDDMNIEDIDNIIENADIIKDIEDKVNSQVLLRDRPLNLKPKLAGAPGMVIDLDDNDNAPKKSGVELLKERFTFFAKLKTPEELEREKERKIKPGNQHLKLKQELEEQMAEQRSLEWAKRLEEEKQQQKELRELRGEESEDENDIDKLEAKLESEEKEADVSQNEEEEELEENDVDMNDKPRAKNPMLENEAEESDCDENEVEVYGYEQNEEDGDENEVENAGVNDNDDEDDDEDSSESESEPEEQPTTKKGRILKAFEDSDDEEDEVPCEEASVKSGIVDLVGSQTISQDDVLTLAQRHKSASEDLFSQGSSLQTSQKVNSPTVPESSENDVDLGTQTFSILDSTNNVTADLLNSSADKLGVIGETQPYDDNLAAVAAMCSGSFSQSLLPITQFSQSQPIGEDILALCTGKFYENEFVSQVDDNNQIPLGASQEFDSQNDSQRTDTQTKPDKLPEDKIVEAVNDKVIDNINEEFAKTDAIDMVVKANSKEDGKKVVDDHLKSILDELDDPEFDTPKPNKFFCGAKTLVDSKKDKEVEVQKKKFIIDSDDETIDENGSETKKRKKFKKKRPEKRALQISDDEEDEVSEQDEMEEYESEIEEETTERLVEYDSEENEIEVQPQILKPLKKKRKANEFFEQEAELTSEDEWVGSGDEDEAGLDRMEREAGDDETFHQGQLQRELGQIHMRDVLDQDKREVRIIQELLFEDGDLGGGGRQRKFKWKNLDGDEEDGVSEELRDTQEEEFESEEQWRKQRHERETFLRQMQNSENDESLNVSINRTTIIKANLMSKTMSMLLEEHKTTEKTEKVDPVVVEKKTASIPSPKKPFSILQQSYQGSILNRGKGALARLAALATPLAVDDDAPKGKSAAPGSRRNFVFATLTPEPPKVTKRKAEIDPSTPKLVKKMKTEEKQNNSRNSLLDRMNL